MLKETIYVVSSYGGEWEDKWEHTECAFTDRDDAAKFIEEKKRVMGVISDDEYFSIQQAVTDKLYKIQCQFFDSESGELLKGKTIEDFDKAYDDFDENEKYDFIKEKFGYTKEEFETKENMVSCELTGYRCKEVKLLRREIDDK